MMGCNVQDIVSWYQKKIGTYDKQQWEKTVEQRILSGLTHVPKRTAKLKTELIDVDLVRGSAFTKAKPKHGLLTVTRLAALRLFLLPFYYQWWICQTSSRIFIALLILYSVQLFNTFLYFSAWFPLDAAFNTLENIPPSEVLVPFAMMLVLSIIHSQIVSTHSANGRAKKQEIPSNSYHKRSISRRTRRRNASITKNIKNTESKIVQEGENSGALDGKFAKRSRVKISTDDNGRVHRRSVVWDTTPVKSKPSSRSYKDHEDSGAASLDSSCSMQIPELRASLNDIEQIGGIDRMQMPEDDSPQTPTTLDDDGFESLDGNGSCDSNKEEQDISFTAEEYETAVKNSPVHDSIDNGLVIVKSCPKYNKKDISLSTCCKSMGAACAKHDKQIADECVKITLNGDKTVSNKRNCSFEINCVPARAAKICDDFGARDDINSQDDIEDDSDTDGSISEPVSENIMPKKRLLTRRRGSQQNLSVNIKNLVESSFNSSGDDSEDDAGTLSSPGSSGHVFTEGTTSAGEWGVGVTTNSEECSYSSEIDGSDNQIAVTSDNNDHPFAWEMEMMPNVILSPSCAPVGKVSCTMWEKKDVKKANLSVLDISSAIIARVEAMPENVDYFYIGIVMSIALAMVPSISRLADSLYDSGSKGTSYFGMPSGRSDTKLMIEPFCPIRNPNTHKFYNFAVALCYTAFGSTLRENIVILLAMFERFCLAAIFFFLLTVAERTFKQRFLYAKFFSHLTSFRRAKKSELPHFRLNKVRNIKSWLSVRSYLKKRGPQRSVDVIVSTAFLITVILLSFLSVELLKDSEYNVEAVGWCIVIGFFMLRFMTLGTKINRKYRNLSTIITEQINLYLQIEQKPNKKEELMVANSVLKLAADLLKELESPFKISGLSANPYLYTVTKVVMLSALSGILSELLGFKLKLHKIKIK
ncbi:protein phtf [Planococcus citri]|uniref:protein phtf n=1 Tax=Planococcus citri TaxID=170843 RepID=UPI0031F90868